MKQINTPRKANEVDLLVGTALRVVRESKGISQETLGHILGVSSQQVQKYERGTNRISAGNLYLCAEYLGVSLCHFVENCDQHPPQPSLPYNLLEKYHALPSDKQKIIIEMIDVFHEEK